MKPDLSLGKSLNCIKSLIGCFFNGRDLGRDAKTYGFPAGSIFLSPLPFFLAPSPSPPSFSHPRLPHKIEPARRLILKCLSSSSFSTGIQWHISNFKNSHSFLYISQNTTHGKQRSTWQDSSSIDCIQIHRNDYGSFGK